MKLLHTSDWHIGHVLYDHDRTAEFEAFFVQLASIVAQEKPDVMVVSGDVFNYNTPSALAQKLFTDGLLSVCRQKPDMPVFVAAGNHDSPSRLCADAALWQSHGVHIVGTIRRNADGRFLLADVVCEVPGVCMVACVPYFSGNVYPAAEVFAAVEEEVARRNAAGLPVVVMGHLYISGCKLSVEREDVGGLEFSPVSALGSGYDYVALGHIHRPQFVAGTEHRVRYCGTPVAVSFDEVHPHCVDIVEVERGGSPVVRSLPIEPTMQLLTVPAKPAPLEEALRALAEVPQGTRAYVRLNVLLEDYLPADAQNRAVALCNERSLSFCLINTVRKMQERHDDELRPNMTISEFKRLSPLEVALRCYKTRYGCDMSEEMKTALNNIIKEVEQ